MDEENKRSNAINPGLVSSLLKVLASDASYSAQVTEELKCYGDNSASVAYLMGYIHGLRVGGRYT